MQNRFDGRRAAIPRPRRAGGGAILDSASISGLGGDSGLTASNGQPDFVRAFEGR